MAGEIAQDVAVMMALSSAAIGAGGAIVSQIVAGVITGRRENKKSKTEAERWKLEADAKRRDRQFDHKIELFSKFLAIAEDMGRAGQPFVGSTQDLTDSVKEASKQLKDLAEEIGILAPELFEIAQSTVNAASSFYFGFVSHTLVSKGRTANDVAKEDSVTRLREARFSLNFWSDAFRDATRSYISHEPILSRMEAAAIHEELMKNERDIESSL